jgi:hypothetical protein
LTKGAASSGGGASGGTLNNCTLTRNSAGFGGGGASYSTLNNCTLTGNSAQGGGAAVWCILNNCTLISNVANSGSGGGANSSTLNNCTLTGNSAMWEGGGANSCTLNNCILFGNTNRLGCEDCGSPGSLLVNNWIGDPLFAASGNLRLQSNSPCINAGRNAFAPAGLDPDGNERIRGGTVDLGAYEFQSPQSTISYAWLQQYALLTDGSADAADPDRDGLNNWQEWRCRTDPTSALSALRLLSPVPSFGTTTVTVAWQSIVGVNYFLERGTNLAGSSAFTPLISNLPGQPGTTTYADTNGIGGGRFFYRVGISTP